MPLIGEVAHPELHFEPVVAPRAPSQTEIQTRIAGHLLEDLQAFHYEKSRIKAKIVRQVQGGTKCQLVLRSADFRDFRIPSGPPLEIRLEESVSAPERTPWKGFPGCSELKPENIGFAVVAQKKRLHGVGRRTRVERKCRRLENP